MRIPEKRDGPQISSPSGSMPSQMNSINAATELPSAQTENSFPNLPRRNAGKTASLGTKGILRTDAPPSHIDGNFIKLVSEKEISKLSDLLIPSSNELIYCAKTSKTIEGMVDDKKQAVIEGAYECNILGITGGDSTYGLHLWPKLTNAGEVDQLDEKIESAKLNIIKRKNSVRAFHAGGLEEIECSAQLAQKIESSVKKATIENISTIWGKRTPPELAGCDGMANGRVIVGPSTAIHIRSQKTWYFQSSDEEGDILTHERLQKRFAVVDIAAGDCLVAKDGFFLGVQINSKDK